MSKARYTLDSKLYDRETDLPIYLLTIDIPDKDEPILLSTDDGDELGKNSYGEPIFGTRVINKDKDKDKFKEYLYAPLELVLPGQHAEQIESGKITVSNITRVLTPYIRGMSTLKGTIKLKIELIMYDGTEESKYRILYTVENIELRDITFDNYSVDFEMTGFSLHNEPFPADNVVPSNFPALFKATK